MFRRTGVIRLVVMSAVSVTAAVLVGCSESASGTDVGECIKVSDAEAVTANDDLEVVGCEDPAAEYKVVQKVENSTECGSDIEAWFSEVVGDSSTVLCLQPA